jgi:hypothetical protein
MTMRRGRSVSWMARRSSSVGFPSRRGTVSYASLKRRVMASGVFVMGFIRKLGEFGIFSLGETWQRNYWGVVFLATTGRLL